MRNSLGFQHHTGHKKLRETALAFAVIAEPKANLSSPESQDKAFFHISHHLYINDSFETHMYQHHHSQLKGTAWKLQHCYPSWLAVIKSSVSTTGKHGFTEHSLPGFVNKNSSESSENCWTAAEHFASGEQGTHFKASCACNIRNGSKTAIAILSLKGISNTAF